MTHPIDKYYLLNILTHTIKWQSLYKEIPISNENEKKINILIVDDNDLCRHAIVRLLNKYEHQVTPCSDGEYALKKISEDINGYNLAMIDYHMPNMNGIELIKHIKNYERIKNMDPMDIICIYKLNGSINRR